MSNLHSVQVQITRKWIPEGKKNFKLQDSSGVIYDTFPNDAEKVQEGQSVLLDYEDKEFNGRPYKQTKRLTVTQGGTPMPAQQQVNNQNAMVSSNIPYHTQPAPASQSYGADRRDVGLPSQPAPRPSNGPPVVDEKRHMWMTGIVGRWGQSGKFSPEEMREIARFASECYAEFFQ